MSLGDCSQVNGKTDNAKVKSYAWDKFQNEISEAAKNKKNIIFDLRSNHGGYYEYPAKMLTSVFYCNHTDKEELENIEALFENTITKDCTFLVSPLVMQNEKELYEKYWKSQFENMPEERQKFFKDYLSPEPQATDIILSPDPQEEPVRFMVAFLFHAAKFLSAM